MDSHIPRILATRVHVTDKVPFVMANTDLTFKCKDDAALCDVAPTVLELMGLPIPAEMTGNSLLKK
jgi:2,3-bisphosphoglycerate-independent phosphoglycerate mutase